MTTKSSIRSTRVTGIAIAAMTAVAFANGATAQEKETIRQVQQGLVSLTPVSAADQERLGLLTLSSGCSASLLRNDWIITAAHCVDDPDTTMAGRFVLRPENSIRLTATWSTPQDRQSVRIISLRPFDIALIRVASPFTVAGSSSNYNREVFKGGELLGLPITAFGRGINEFAKGSGATATPAQTDNQFRLGLFDVFIMGRDSYTYALWRDKIGGGDSGGPSFVTSDGREMILGVHSTATLECMPGKTCGTWPGPGVAPPGYSEWRWATGTGVASDAWIAPVWDEIDRYLGAPPTAREPVRATARVRVASNDFNGDGRGDILWHNASTGEAQVWLMSGTSRIGRANIADAGRPTLIGPPWRIVGSRDFNRDGRTDILWHNSSTSAIQIWYMNGHNVNSRATVLGEGGNPALVGSPWSIVGANDMNGDGKSDIVWHNSSSGETQIWHVDGHRVLGRATVLGENGIAAAVGAPWSIVGTGDFSGDRKPDLLWHNSSSGESQVWKLDGYKVTGRATVLGENGTAIEVGLPWRITGTNDFDQSGSADILWHNGSTGHSQVWHMTANRVIGRATVDAVRDGGGSEVRLPWSIVSH